MKKNGSAARPVLLNTPVSKATLRHHAAKDRDFINGIVGKFGECSTLKRYAHFFRRKTGCLTGAKPRVQTQRAASAVNAKSRSRATGAAFIPQR